jgi:hypothetical protein
VRTRVGVKESYPTLRLYQGVSEVIPGMHLVNLARWKNAAHDKIDDVYVTGRKNKAKLTELFRKALESWIPELPDVQPNARRAEPVRPALPAGVTLLTFSRPLWRNEL